MLNAERRFIFSMIVNLDELNVYLFEDDICALVTVDGQFYGIWSDEEESCYKIADEIQGEMVDLMKESHHRYGVWIWRFKENDAFSMWYLGEYDG